MTDLNGSRGMRLIAGNSNPMLVEKIGTYLGLTPVKTDVRRFSDDEIFVEVHENVRGEDMFVIQSTSCPANDNLMELLIMIDALRRASARRITAVIPYFGYARQDRKVGPRTPISAKLVANMITEAGANRVLTVDLHAGQIQGFFDIPTDNLFAMPVIVKDIGDHLNGKEPVVVSPDVGGVVRARALATRLNTDLAIVDKRREKAGVSEVMNIIGDVEGRPCILIDDIVDSGGTLCNAADALLANGATEVYAYATHGVLSGKAVERIGKSKLKSMVVTDTIEATPGMKNCPNLRTITIAPLLGEAMRRINNEASVSSLFDSMLKLFYGPNACSLASHIALAEAGAEFETVRLDLKAGDQRKPEYLAVNPKGRVPALVTPQGTLTESVVILNWVAETYPAARLKPEGDFFAFSEMQMFNLYLATTVHIAFAHLFRAERWADSEAARADMRAKVPGNLAQVFQLVEERLRDGRSWVCGDRYTVADCYLYVFARWLERDGAGGSSAMPLTRAHRTRMQQRPAVQRVLAAEGIEPL